MPRIELYPHQKEAIEKLKSGSILCGGVGTGKSITALAYFYIVVCGGALSAEGIPRVPTNPRFLYIITTARKRDTFEWEAECARWGLSTKPLLSAPGIEVTVDSWNNIAKYEGAEGAFFIFDEQRVVGSGAWVKSFLKIAKRNDWILLSATPGDSWMDYIPVFLANGFYKNRTQFLRRHAVFNPRVTFPKVERWLDTGYLEFLRHKIMVTMDFRKKAIPHFKMIQTSYSAESMKRVVNDRWDIWKQEPIRDVTGLCYAMRRVVNEDPSRLNAVRQLLLQFCPKLIVFYNFDYELEILREGLKNICPVAEWNGHKHEPIPEGDSWAYLVQYSAGAEGWNCVETNRVCFYSQNYSYRSMIQAAGRIDRLNTPFTDLYYYILRSDSFIDNGIAKSLSGKKNFNERAFVEDNSLMPV